MKSATAIVDTLLETSLRDSAFLEEPITGVTYGRNKYAFYPYLGKPKDSRGRMMGLIKTRNRPTHGTFYTVGQHFYFEPAP